MTAPMLIRRAGDGVMRVGASGQIAYASPNAVNTDGPLTVAVGLRGVELLEPNPLRALR